MASVRCLPHAPYGYDVVVAADAIEQVAKVRAAGSRALATSRLKMPVP
jgi:hypothetical protein